MSVWVKIETAASKLLSSNGSERAPIPRERPVDLLQTARVVGVVVVDMSPDDDDANRGRTGLPKDTCSALNARAGRPRVVDQKNGTSLQRGAHLELREIIDAR